MKKLIFTLCFFSVVATVSGCAGQPANMEKKTGNTAEEQRVHAEKAQGELSSEVRK